NGFLILSFINFLLLAFVFFSQKQGGQSPAEEVPPIILIPDNAAFRFPVGSAQLSQPLRKYIRERLAESVIANRYKYKIDTVEVIGHTDGQPNRSRVGNLDFRLEESAVTNRLDRLTPGSNTDLGLMRALAIANELRKIQAQRPELKGLNFRAYSAGQLYLPTGELSPPNRKDDPSRRRIEVRFTRLGRIVEVSSQ
ncbi:MAG: hypothetical protein NZ482_10085, partial [Gloeomargarita sp. SKYG98]|nr:hypothetical protein [Gloeomargarita sp. SKYG98]